MHQKYWLGFDLGGTKMLAALLNADLEVLHTVKQETPSALTPEILTELMIQTIEAVLAEGKISKEQISGMGMGVPGPVSKQGVIVSAPNLGLLDFPLQALMEKRLGFPVLVENDVNAGTYGEYILGAAQGHKHVLGMFPGTGVGGAVISEGILLRGARGCGAELGHMIVSHGGARCGCGLYGDIEALCSRSSLSKEASAIAGRGKSPTIFEKAGTDYRKIKSSLLKKAYSKGEPEIVELIDRSAHFLGVGIGNLVTIFDPEIVVIGGGLVEKFGKEYVKKVKKAMIAHTMNPFVSDIQIVEASLADFAVFQGAVSLLAVKLRGE